MKNVLLVDDDHVFNFLSTKMLEHMSMGFNVHAVLNGKEALDFLSSRSAETSSLPDLLLLDLNMPVMDGFDFMEAFGNLDFPGKDKVLIVALSSSDNVDDVTRIMSLGAKHYLSKPLAEDQLRTLIG